MRSSNSEEGLDINIEKFTEQNMKWVRKDTFINKARDIYGNEIIFKDSENILKVNIRNQNKGINDFVNTRLDLYKVKDFDFNIETIQGETHANFKIEKRNGIEYIHLPTDVIIGLISQLN